MTPPLLSVVVAIVSDTTDSRVSVRPLKECLDRLTTGQIDPPKIEIIVPYLNHVDGVDGLMDLYPSVVWLPLSEPDMSRYRGGGREHHDVIRAKGLAAASGEIVALLEDHELAGENWARAIVEAHRSAYAGIGGAIENAVDRPLNWSVYFCDFGRYQNPAPAGETTFASDANTSYKRADLEAIRPVWEDSFREVVVNAALAETGRKVALDPHVIAFQNRKDLKFGSALRERFIWGRSYAATRRAQIGAGKRLLYAAMSPALPFILFARHAAIARSRRRRFGDFIGASPITLLLLSGWAAGELTGYLAGVEDPS